MKLQILPSTEIDGMIFMSRKGHPQTTEIKETLVKCKVGEGFKVSRADYTANKNGPGTIVTALNKKLKGAKRFSYRRLSDQSGWILMRVL